MDTFPYTCTELGCEFSGTTLRQLADHTLQQHAEALGVASQHARTISMNETAQFLAGLDNYSFNELMYKVYTIKLAKG